MVASNFGLKVLQYFSFGSLGGPGVSGPPLAFQNSPGGWRSRRSESRNGTIHFCQPGVAECHSPTASVGARSNAPFPSIVSLGSLSSLRLRPAAPRRSSPPCCASCLFVAAHLH